MQLIGRVLLLALCVFSAYSFPSTINIINRTGSVDNVLKEIEITLHNHFDSSNQTNSNNTNSNNTQGNSTTNNTINSCFAKYTIQQKVLNNQTLRRTEACYQLNNQSSIVNNQTVNSTLTEVNTTSYHLQHRLAHCAGRNSSDDVFNCYVFTFDRNLKDLSDIAELSILASNALSGNFTELEIAQRACVSSVITASKTDAIVALNELEDCANRAGNSTNIQ